MLLLTLLTGTGPRLGVRASGGSVIDVTALGECLAGQAPPLDLLRTPPPPAGTGRGYVPRPVPGGPARLENVAAAGQAALDVIAALLAAEPGGDQPWRTPYERARLDVPLVPPAVLCSGENYTDHLAEKPPASNREPEFFLKAPTTVAAPGATIPVDRRVTGKLDSEVELAVIIGKPGRDIPVQDALSHVFGYTIALDLSARDRQMIRHTCGGWMYDLVRGKNFDGALPLGPVVATRDEIPDPQDLALRGYVDGRCMQASSTRQMIWPVAELISYLSRFLTLVPGTVIATGTPGGTAWGFDAEIGGTRAQPGVPAPYVTGGQRLRGEIERIGDLSVTVSDA